MNVFKNIKFNEPNEEQYRISGGISEAITDPYCQQANKHAKLYYEEIRNMSTDVQKISENTGIEFDSVLMVKQYLFINEHNLGGTIKRFAPSFEIAESWQRLAFDKDNIQSHDITLLKHELKEMLLVSQGLSQDQAHIIASKEFNYSKESELFYRGLGKKIVHYEEQNSGAINYTDYGHLDGRNY